jgi:ArsR family transcriptional regulator
MKDFLKVMKALSDANRVKIVKMLQHKVMCVCELQAALKLAQPTVSRHLQVLEDAGLVSCRKEGLWVNCLIPRQPGNLYAAEILARLKDWLNGDPEVGRILEELHTFRREDICKK